MDRVSYVAAVAVGVLALVLVCAWFSEPAEGAASSCETTPAVTVSEWSRVDIGMTRAKVRAVLDGDGTLGPSVGVRVYPVCGKRSWRAVVWYREGGHVMDGGFWLEVR